MRHNVGGTSRVNSRGSCRLRTLLHRLHLQGPSASRPKRHPDRPISKSHSHGKTSKSNLDCQEAPRQPSFERLESGVVDLPNISNLCQVRLEDPRPMSDGHKLHQVILFLWSNHQPPHQHRQAAPFPGYRPTTLSGIQVEQNENEFDHQLSGRHIPWLFFRKQKGGERDEWVRGLLTDGDATDVGGRERFDASEEFVQKLVVVLLFSVKRWFR